MAKQSIKKGSQTIGINMPKKMADEIEKRASSMHLTTSNYCKIILGQWMDSGQTLTLEENKNNR